jgi:hypothetical protein
MRERGAPCEPADSTSVTTPASSQRKVSEVLKIFPRHRASGSRVLALAALAATIVLALTTGFAGSAGASVTSPHKLTQVPCRPYTFNVHYGVRSEKCYEGVGGPLLVRIPDVREITVGENTGRFVVILHKTLVVTERFTPKHAPFRFGLNQAVLVSITITHK